MRFSMIMIAGVLAASFLSAESNVSAQPPNKKPKSAKTSASTKKSTPIKGVGVRYETDSVGNKARYRVRERLVGKELDNDAIGETSLVTGVIAIDADGKIVAGSSGFTANVTNMKSDQNRRDSYVKRRLLVVDSFPITTLRINDVRGLTSPLPTSGETKFQLFGDLTVKGITRPTVWNVIATVNGDKLTGIAATRFTFKDFEMTQPSVSVLLTVADTIGLEYNFVMTKKKTAKSAF